MKNQIAKVSLCLVLLVAAACQQPADVNAANDAVELRIVTSGGFAAAHDILAPQFERDSGIKLITEYGSSSGGSPTSIPARLERGEKFDIIILADYSLENLTAAGYVRPESRRDLVLSKIGMAVREGAVIPDISTPERFIQVMRDAESFGYSASASGTYLATELFPRLGLWQEFEPKGKRIVGDRVGTIIARGEVEIGFQQVSEILPIAGVEFAGTIPDEYQLVTIFSAAITAQSDHVAEAQRLLDYFTSTEVADAVAATGLQPIPSGH
ncbi:MAG: substrate-binding domain-containing protein [Gammaproteobacteria bacterium]|nr:substrate-binding domain-containing protein [Gammaproteobacteria bacterium]